MDIITAFLLFCGIVVVVPILFLRNNLVLSYRIEALKIIDKRVTKAIHEGEDWEQLKHRYDRFYGTYYTMFLNFRKWKFEHFFPDLVS